MIVFWRLFLAFILTDMFFFHKTINESRKINPIRTTVLQLVIFWTIALGLCHNYLTMQWPFLDLINMPGWACIILCGLFQAFADEYFQYGGKMKYGYLATFFVKNFANLFFLFLCVPFHTLYETGNFFAEASIIFCVGVVIVLRLLGWLSMSIEQDFYGKESASLDERWMLMIMRLIFFLLMLLPGIRWLILLIIWLATCIYARNSRLLDISKSAFYVGIWGSVIIGALLRYRLYFLDL